MSAGSFATGRLQRPLQRLRSSGSRRATLQTGVHATVHGRLSSAPAASGDQQSPDRRDGEGRRDLGLPDRGRRRRDLASDGVASAPGWLLMQQWRRARRRCPARGGMPMVVSHPVWLQLQLSRRMRRRTRRPWLNSHHSQADAPSCQVPPRPALPSLAGSGAPTLTLSSRPAKPLVGKRMSCKSWRRQHQHPRRSMRVVRTTICSSMATGLAECL